VILARSAKGEVEVFPLAENVHRQGILHTTTVPASVTPAVAAKAQAWARAVAEAMNYVGVMCLEFFVLDSGELVANEMAPRPHNSGHYTIEACETSQFEQQVRICVGDSLGPTALRFPVRMTNLLGDHWFPNGPDRAAVEPDWKRMVKEGKAVLHLYGKSEPRPGRKMGHITERLD
jgi:5-(carboxyamino)imidazole ribonucleotide synthase